MRHGVVHSMSRFQGDSEYQPPTNRGFWTLNALRVFSIISLVSSIVAAIATLIKSFVATKFFFFDAVNHISLAAICIFLILSECSLMTAYFKRSWPMLASHSSLTWLGVAEIGVGFSLLGNLNEDFASKESLGTAFNSLLIASGVCVSVTGLLSLIASFIYRIKTTGETARMLRSVQRRRQHRKHQLAAAAAIPLDSPFSSTITSDGIPKSPEPVYSRGRSNADGGYGHRIPSVAHRDKNGFFHVPTPVSSPVQSAGAPVPFPPFPVAGTPAPFLVRTGTPGPFPVHRTGTPGVRFPFQGTGTPASSLYGGDGMDTRDRSMYVDHGVDAEDIAHAYRSECVLGRHA